VLYFAGGEAELPTVPEDKKIKRSKANANMTSEVIDKDSPAEGSRRRTKKVVE